MTPIQSPPSRLSSDPRRGQLQHQRHLTQLLKTVGRSQTLFRVDTPYYEDALHLALMDSCLGIEMIETEQTCHCHNQSFTERLTYNLNKHLQKLQQAERTPKQLQPPPNEIPRPEAIRQWVMTDPSGVLRSTHLEGKTCINCQMLILRQLSSAVSWQALSTEFDVPLATLGKFYQCQCISLLRQLQDRDFHSLPAFVVSA